MPNAQIFRNHIFFHVCIVHGPCKAIWADFDSTKVVLAENDHFLCFGLSRSNYHPQSERKFPQTAATRKKNIVWISLVVGGRSIFQVHGNWWNLDRLVTVPGNWNCNWLLAHLPWIKTRNSNTFDLSTRGRVRISESNPEQKKGIHSMKKHVVFMGANTHIIIYIYTYTHLINIYIYISSYTSIFGLAIRGYSVVRCGWERFHYICGSLVAFVLMARLESWASWSQQCLDLTVWISQIGSKSMPKKMVFPSHVFQVLQMCPDFDQKIADV